MAFKNLINAELLARMGKSILFVYPKFPYQKFINLTFELQSLELKQRIGLIKEQLYHCLPFDYPKAIEILLRSVEESVKQKQELKGFDLWPYTDFVQTYGLLYFEESMKALYYLTPKFTSEFAIRPFLNHYPELTLNKLMEWSNDPDYHVRRWVSEGTRPRLPWGEKLKFFISNPAPGLKILEQLKYDSEIYVRKSVANHLNDISKDHPDLVISVLKRWKKDCLPQEKGKILWIIKQGLRTLIKNGHPQALKLLGVLANPQLEISKFKLNKKFFTFKEDLELEFSFSLVSTSGKKQKLVIDYIVHHVRLNKKLSGKVFKLKNLILDAYETVTITKKHSLKPVTTRKYYSGEHFLEIQINGKIRERKAWQLKSNGG